MTKLLIAATAALSLPLTLAGQDSAQIMKDYMRQIVSDDVSLNVVHLNSQTVPVLFQPPMLYSMRARAQQQMMI